MSLQIIIGGKEENVLVLNIIKQWYDMIHTGEKKEEYRSRSDYYRKRFINFGLLSSDGTSSLKTGIILFRNGYSSNSPQFAAKCMLNIGYGKPEWGAVSGEIYYKLVIMEVYELEGESNEGKNQ